MPPAYTAYKLRKMIGLVFTIFIMLAILSQVNPAKSAAEKELVEAFDPSNTASNAAMEIQGNLDIESQAKQGIGDRLFILLTVNTMGFLILVIIVALILFGSGVYLRNVRKILRRI